MASARRRLLHRAPGRETRGLKVNQNECPHEWSEYSDSYTGSDTRSWYCPLCRARTWSDPNKQVSDAMLQAAIRKARDLGHLPEQLDPAAYQAAWVVMKQVLLAALAAPGPLAPNDPDEKGDTIEALLARRAAIDKRLAELRKTEERDAIEKYFPEAFGSFIRYLRLHQIALVYHGGGLGGIRVPADIETQLAGGVAQAWPEQHGFSASMRERSARAVIDNLFDESARLQRGESGPVAG